MSPDLPTAEMWTNTSFRELTPTVLENFGRFREGLRGFGWLEGRNLVLDYRAAEGRPDRVAELAAAGRQDDVGPRLD